MAVEAVTHNRPCATRTKDLCYNTDFDDYELILLVVVLIIMVMMIV